MSIMSRIRNNIVLVVVVIALAILAFTVQDAISNFVGGGSAPTDVGEVAGQSISIQEFNQRYQVQTSNMRGPTNTPLSDQQLNSALETTWGQLTSNIIIDKQAQEIGLKVTSSEMANIFTGTETPYTQYIRNFFGSTFDNVPEGSGYTQGFSGANVRRYIQFVQDEGTPEVKLQFKDFETSIRDFRRRDRLDKMLQAAYTSSSTYAKQLYMEKNRTYDISYVSVPYSTIPDSVINSDVTDSDYKAFMNENKDRYEQEASTQIQYVVFNIIPTAADSAAARAELMRDKGQFTNASLDSTFTIGKTRTPYRNQLLTIGEVPTYVQDDVLNAAPKTVWGPFLARGNPNAPTGSDSYYKLYKLVKSEVSEDETWAKIRASFVPFGQDTSAAKSEARTMLGTARSQGIDSLDNVRELNWYNKAGFSEDFNSAVANASVGSVIGPLETTQGWAIVEVQNKTNKRFGIAEIESLITYSDATKDNVDKEAAIFSDKAMKANSVEVAANEAGLVSYPSPQLTVEMPATTPLTGLKEGARPVIRWALGADNKEFSEILQAGDAFVFAQVISKKAAGMQSVAEVRASIKTQVFNRKRAEIISERLSSIGTSGDLASIVSAYNDQYGGGMAIQSTATGITFNSDQISGIGGAPKVVGTVAGMELNATKGPIDDVAGVYVVQLTNIGEPTEPDAGSIQTEKAVDAGSARQVANRINAALREIADIQDNRYKAGF